MCGIAGYIAIKNNTAEESIIRQMTAHMAHRGPDAGSCFLDGEVALGHRRLSIIDLSTSANQPFTDVSGRYTMVFNGEIYNYAEVKSLLPDYPFCTTSDTEALLAAYAKWGPDCIGYLRGMFAFAIFDRRDRSVFLARDRMGVKPLYYYQDDSCFMFASEVRSILSSGKVRRRVDQRALLDYFSYQSVTSPDSLIEQVRQLEAGTWMLFSGGRCTVRRYWDMTDIRRGGDGIDSGPAGAAIDMDDEVAVKKNIRQLMLQSVGRRLVSDVPVGAFLSGGIDSSVVVALMAEAGDDRPNTFNISFEEKEYDESYYAELIAKKYNTRHTRLRLRPDDFLEQLTNALDAMDTPSGDGVNTYVVSKAIRESGMTVALSGVGGDELFAGYPFFDQYLQLRAKDWIWKIPGAVRRGMTAMMPDGISRGRSGRILQLLSAPSSSIDQLYSVGRQILSPRLMSQLTNLPEEMATTLHDQLSDLSSGLERMPLLSQVSVAEYMGYTQQTLLKDTDQMSMAVSLEVREPFFDQDLVEFVLAIPDKWKKPVYPKSLLVESMKPLLPDEIVFRKKQGFLFPWEVWLRNELRSFCEKHIDSASQRSFINGQKLKDYWRRFLSGDKDVRWAEIWLFVVLEYWLSKNNVE